MTDNPIALETDGDVAACVEGLFGARELRDLASNAGVSRERGDTKGETARKIVGQDPALAAKILENAHPLDVPADCAPFKERREVGGGTISLDEAIRRARHRKMRLKLESLKRALAKVPKYDAEVDWEYASDIRDGTSSVDRGSGHDPGLTAIQVRAGEEIEDLTYLVRGRAHIHLTAHGRCTMFTTDSGTGERTHIDRNTAEPSKAWRVALRSIEGFYEPDG